MLIADRVASCGKWNKRKKARFYMLKKFLSVEGKEQLISSFWSVSRHSLDSFLWDLGLTLLSPPRPSTGFSCSITGQSDQKVNRYWNIANAIFASGVFFMSLSYASFPAYLKKWKNYTVKFQCSNIHIYWNFPLYVCMCVCVHAAWQFTLRRLAHFVIFSMMRKNRPSFAHKVQI